MLPIWIQLPQLPLHLWGEPSIGKIASVSYARVLVEVDVTQPLKDHVIIRDHKEKMIRQSIVYEWKSSFCPTCLKIGHDCTKKKMTQPKPTQPRRGKKVVGVWQARPPVDVVNNVSKQPEPSRIPADTGTMQCGTSAQATQWTDVRPGSVARRSSPTVIVGQVHCQNGFSPLRIGNDSLGCTDKVP